MRSLEKISFLTQLDRLIYFYKGHCYVLRKKCYSSLKVDILNCLDTVFFRVPDALYELSKCPFGKIIPFFMHFWFENEY